MWLKLKEKKKKKEKKKEKKTSLLVPALISQVSQCITVLNYVLVRFTEII